MPEPLHVVEYAAGTPLEQVLRAEAAKGGRVIVFLSAVWAPPSRVLNQSLSEPAVAALLVGSRVVVVDVDTFGAELQALGMKVTGVPALCAWDPAGGVLSWLSGNAWGKDTVENIAAALAKWVPTLPAPPDPREARSQKIVGILGLLLALALLVGAAIWQVAAQRKADREQSDRQMRERMEEVRKDVADSVRSAMEKSHAP